MNNPFNNLELPQFEPNAPVDEKPRRGRPPRQEAPEPVKSKLPIQATAETAHDLDVFATMAAIWNKLPADQRARIHKALGKLL